MKISQAKNRKIKKIKEEYRKYLMNSANITSSKTVNTYSSEAFKLQRENNAVFWEVLQSDNFEKDAKDAFENLGLSTDEYLPKLRSLKRFIELTEIPEDDEEASIKEFLYDINCLQPVTEWIEKINLFGVLKISTMEIKHSNMLAWLLDPNERHGFRDGILRGVIRYYLKASSESIDSFDVLLNDLYSFVIKTEAVPLTQSRKDRIDILAVSDKLHTVICIENKTKSKEHDNQLAKYKDDLDKKYHGYEKKWLLFLTPKKEDPQDPQDQVNWVPIGYQDILSIIKTEKEKVTLSTESAILIDHYEEAITRDLVGDDELEKICQKIYNKHQLAIELIKSNSKNNKRKEDPLSNLCRQINSKYQREIEHITKNSKDQLAQAAAVFREWAQNKAADKETIVFNDQWSDKRYTRFTTKRMSDLLPDAESISDWRTHNYYFYEIYSTDGESFSMKLELNSTDIPDEIKTKCASIIARFLEKGNGRDNWRWCTVYQVESSSLIKKGDVLSQKDEIFVQLDGMLEKVLEFETSVVEFFKESEEAAREGLF